MADKKEVRTPTPDSVATSTDTFDRQSKPEPLFVEEKKTFWQRVKEPGSVWQIIIAAVMAIVIGLAVTMSVDEVPEAVTVILAIPGNLWLRALRAVGKTFHSQKH